MKFLVFIDCLLNVLVGGSFNETLSAHAWKMHIKPQPYFGWLAGFIDFFFSEGHCERQALRESDPNWKRNI